MKKKSLKKIIKRSSIHRVLNIVTIEPQSFSLPFRLSSNLTIPIADFPLKIAINIRVKVVFLLIFVVGWW